MYQIITCLLMLSLSFSALSQDKKKSVNLKYKYKSRESFDLGGISIQGNVISSGDITAKDKSESDYQVQLPNRLNFDPEQAEDIDMSY